MTCLVWRSPTTRRSARAVVVLLPVALVLVLGALVWWYAASRVSGPESAELSQAVDKRDARGVWFEEVSDAAGISFHHMRGPKSRYWFPEIMGAGAALFDYDGDADLDLYLVQGGDLDPSATDARGNVLYRNRGDGTFEDVTASTGVGDTSYGMGCTCGDFDGDGDVDLYVTNVGPNVLYRNDGNGSFTDVSVSAGVADPGWGTSAAFVDYDRDGDLDLFVVNYLTWSIAGELECASASGVRDYCKPNNYNSPAADTLYRNNGDGTFTDVSETSGIRKAFGNGLGVALGDFDADGFVDIYVANDGMENQLWINDGSGGFSNGALLAGCAVNVQGKAEAGMGVAALDVENDGDVDLFMTHLRDESNTFYINRGGWFDDATAMMGLSGPSIPSTGFGTGFADFDLDGHLDLYVANGRVGIWEPSPDPIDPYAEANQLFRGEDGGRFVEMFPQGGTNDSLLATSRGAVFGDVDGDGRVDVVVTNCGGPARLLRNITKRGYWVMFDVRDETGRVALGAAVMVEIDGKVQWRTVQRAYSYCSSNDPRAHFGLGGVQTVDVVKVRWPDGEVESFGSVEAGATYLLRKGSQSAERIKSN